MCYGTYSTGTWEWNSGWSQLSVHEADHLGNDGSTLIGSYGGSVAGTWIFDSGGWHKITTSQALLVG
jgi:hypothetical protein